MMLRVSLCAALSMVSTAGLAVAPVDDGHGKLSRQLTEIEGMTPAQAAQLCPQDGVTPCSGAIGPWNLNDWVWATQDQVQTFFSTYDPAMATATGVGGFEHFFYADAFLAAMRPTFATFLTYSTSQYAAGWTSTVGSDRVPTLGSVSASITPVSVSGGFGVGPVANPAAVTETGVFLWRATGLGSGNPMAYDDFGLVSSPAGGQALASVLANDRMDGAPATTANVVLAQIDTTSSSVMLDLNDGSVDVAAGVPAGVHTLLYRICALTDPTRCDEAAVSVNVPGYAIVANNDAGTASHSSGGSAVLNVLANDRLGSGPANTANVVLSLVSSTNPAITLDLDDGSVDVAQGAALGSYLLVYRICERANPANCDEASVTVGVAPYLIDAVNDSARASSKVANTAIASVLGNDRFGGAVAKTAKVALSLVTAPIKGVKLNLTTGAVTVAAKTSSGLSSFIYRICERAAPANCDQASVTLDLSGSLK
ncbi:MAG: hypothetical protein ACT4PZ_05240 [Panacagrimonas sp.]